MPEKRSSPLCHPAAVFAGLFLVSLAFQIQSGAWRSDFGGHADEAAHVVTSLMVRDYLAGGFLEDPHPLRFAEGYYERFPRVALGHYPPGFYLVAAPALLLFRTGATLLVLMNFFSAGAGLLLFVFGRRLLRRESGAVMIAFLYVALPQTRTYTAIVMADLLLVVFSLLAALSFLRFLQEGRSRDSLFFGCWAAAAILTKGSGMGLALLPPLALLFSGKGRLLLAPRLWLATLPVLLFAFPWMLLTAGITGEGMQEIGFTEWIRSALPFYGGAIVREAGYTGFAAFSGAALFGLHRGVVRKQPAGHGEAVLWALLMGGLGVALVVPAGLDHRYLMPVIPSLLLLGAGAVQALSPAVPGKWQQVLVAAFALAVLGETARSVQKFYTGASEAVRLAVGEDHADGVAGEPVRLLVVSNATGEGAVIAAAALEIRTAGLQVARGSKILSTSDWMGRGYRLAFETEKEFFAILRNGKIGYLIIDDVLSDAPGHWSATRDRLDTPGDGRLTRIGSVPSWRRTARRAFDVYRFRDESPLP